METHKHAFNSGIIRKSEYFDLFISYKRDNGGDNGEKLASLNFMNRTALGMKERPRGLKGFFSSFFGNSRHLWMWGQ